MTSQKPLQSLEMSDDDNPQIYLIGGLIGLVVGLLAAYFYKRAASESENANGLQATDFVKLALTILGVVRQITELGSGKK